MIVENTQTQIMTLLQGWTGLSALTRNLKTREAVPAQTFTSQQFIDYFEENWSLVAAAGFFPPLSQKAHGTQTVPWLPRWPDTGT